MSAIERVRPLKVCVDPGHGMHSSKAGVYDPGAIGLGGVEEADLALQWGLELAKHLDVVGCDVMLTRVSKVESAPLRGRVRDAMLHECDLLVSLHCNAFDDPRSNGFETLHSSHGTSLELAKAVHGPVQRALGLRDRGLKPRDNLAILKFTPSILLELGFITNAGDLAIVRDGTVRRRVCAVLAQALVDFSDAWHQGGRGA